MRFPLIDHVVISKSCSAANGRDVPIAAVSKVQQNARPYAPVRIRTSLSKRRMRKGGIERRCSMPLEHEMADFLTGHHFFLHQENPRLGILRLDTKGDQRWWLVTRKDLVALSKACAKYAKELEDAD